MASGMTYTMTETTQLSTAEYYGRALCELGAEHEDVVALTAPCQVNQDRYVR